MSETTPVEIQLALSRLSGSIDVMNAKLDQLIEQRADHEERLRSLERVKWIMVGVAAVAGSFGSQIASLFAAK